MPKIQIPLIAVVPIILKKEIAVGGSNIPTEIEVLKELKLKVGGNSPHHTDNQLLTTYMPNPALDLNDHENNNGYLANLLGKAPIEIDKVDQFE